MTTSKQTQMAEVHERITEAVARSVVRGVGEREAFGNHLRALISEYPNVATAYMGWLASRAN